VKAEVEGARMLGRRSRIRFSVWSTLVGRVAYPVLGWAGREQDGVMRDHLVTESRSCYHPPYEGQAIGL
jgi:hypothetical protein